MILLFAGGTVVIALLTPSGFLPGEDQGAFFTQLTLPPGASVNRTTQFADKIATQLRKQPQVQETISIIGFSLLDGASQSNSAFIVTRLKPFGDRPGARNGATAVIAGIMKIPALSRMRARSMPSTCRRSSGFRPMAVFSTSWKTSPAPIRRRWTSVLKGVIQAANQDKRVANAHTTYNASTPAVYLDVDRQKAEALGVNIADIFTTLQATLGGYYVNQFNLYGRVWQVNIQGRGQQPRHRGFDLAELCAQTRRAR